jgi:hypothetical protein
VFTGCGPCLLDRLRGGQAKPAGPIATGTLRLALLQAKVALTETMTSAEVERTVHGILEALVIVQLVERSFGGA